MFNKKSDREKGILSLILLTLGFASIALFGRYLGYHFTPLQQLYLALGVGFLISLGTFERSLRFARLRKIPCRDWVIMFFRILIGYLLAGSLYRASLILTKISNVTFIQSIPVIAILGFILFKEKFTFSKFLLIATAYLGVILISVRDYSSTLSVGKGELFSFISAVLFSLSYVSRKWQTNFLNDKEIAQILLFLGFITLFIASLLLGESLPKDSFGIGVFSAILITGFFNTINIFLINYGFKRVETVLASNLLTLEAVFALIMAFIFYKELPSIKEFVGGILILSSVIAMNKLEAKE